MGQKAHPQRITGGNPYGAQVRPKFAAGRFLVADLVAGRPQQASLDGSYRQNICRNSTLGLLAID
jgi:hypothetical protein